MKLEFRVFNGKPRKFSLDRVSFVKKDSYSPIVGGRRETAHFADREDIIDYFLENPSPLIIKTPDGEEIVPRSAIAYLKLVE